MSVENASLFDGYRSVHAKQTLRKLRSLPISPSIALQQLRMQHHRTAHTDDLGSAHGGNTSDTPARADSLGET